MSSLEKNNGAPGVPARPDEHDALSVAAPIHISIPIEELEEVSGHDTRPSYAPLFDTSPPASESAERESAAEALVVAAPPEKDPAWSALDILRLVILTIAALIVGVFAVIFSARGLLYPHERIAEIARLPLVLVAGQSVAYLLVLAYMYILVTRERRRPDFLSALHWNWPARVSGYLFAGLALSLGLQVVAHFLPMPKELPIDSFFQTPAEAWALSILSVTLAPLMEELFFRGFLYPVLARSLGVPIAILVTAVAFAALHGAQLMFSWGPVLVIFLVGLVLTMVRAKSNSVAASLLVHVSYNGTIGLAMFAATDGFRHLDKLNQ